jgi:hypothetical protein
MPRVYHCKNVPYDVDAVYVARPTKYGNPYSHKDGTLAKYKVETREEAIAKYEEWIRNQPELMAMAKKEYFLFLLSCTILLKIANGE